MTSIRKQSIFALLLLVMAAAVAAVLYLNRPPAQIAEPEYQPVSVDVAVAVKEPVQVEVQAQGTVTALRETTLKSEVSGRIVEVAPEFLVGSYVAEGQVLLRVDPRDYQTELLRAQSAVESAESALAQERGRAQVAQREWEKLPANSQRSQEAKDLYLRKPQLELAEAQLLSAMADLNTARDRLERTIIKAPYAAVIRNKYSELGQFVSAGTQVADVFSVDYAEVRLPIPQSRLDYLALPGIRDEVDDDAPGAEIDLYTDVSGEVKHWPATLHRTEGVFDERSRALYAVARIKDPYALEDRDREPLRLGTFVNANIAGRQFPGIITLPRYVLRAGNMLWVVDENDILRNRKVDVLRTGGDRAFITSGLDEGERVSLTVLDASLTGSRVKINTATPTTSLGPQGSTLPAEATTATNDADSPPKTAAVTP